MDANEDEDDVGPAGAAAGGGGAAAADGLAVVVCEVCERAGGGGARFSEEGTASPVCVSIRPLDTKRDDMVDVGDATASKGRWDVADCVHGKSMCLCFLSE